MSNSKIKTKYKNCIMHVHFLSFKLLIILGLLTLCSSKRSYTHENHPLSCRESVTFLLAQSAPIREGHWLSAIVSTGNVGKHRFWH